MTVRFHWKSLIHSAHHLGDRVMAASAKSILAQALKLSANDRAALVENLILSLEKPDSSLDAEWLKEAEDRLAAYRCGELAAVDADQVFKELGKRT
jgi:putative addiction module component (TIGR02574 family)